MELKIAVQELSRALARAQGIVERKSTMPILAHVLVEARKGNVVQVSATDLDVTFQSEHTKDCEVLKEGAVAVSAKHLYEIVRSLPDAQVTLKRTQNNYLEVKSGAAEFRIVGLPPDDFPARPQFAKDAGVKVEPKDLRWMIDLTVFAASSDETRYNLNGVYFEPALEEGVEPGVRMVATDGHRLSLAQRPLPGEFRLKKGVILPKKGLAEMKKLLLEAEESGVEAETKLGFVENNCVFDRPGLRLTMRLIEGVFPDYRQVIPRGAEKHVRLPRQGFLETLRRISLLSSDKAHAVRLDLSKGVLRVMSQNPDLGEGKEEIGVDYAGEPLKIGFNARYLIDVLTALTADDVVFELADDLSPGVLRPDPEKPADQGFTAVVMPMRI